MLDYHAHVAVLKELRSAIGKTFGDPEIAELCKAVDLDPDAAALGACIDQILAHAEDDGVELDLLRYAAGVWSDGIALYDEMTEARKEVEAALQDPSNPASLALINSGFGRLNDILSSSKQIAADVKALQSEISPLPHLRRHPRQLDKPSAQWKWRDAFLGRRTDAFVRAVLKGATTTKTRAFGFGVLTSYAANTAGSAYLGAVVGGPRRMHRYRDRIARNAVGAWMHRTFKTPPAANLAQQLSWTNAAGKPAFPSELKTILKDALATAYPSRAAPDLDRALRRTIRHLELLDAFKRPDLPQPPSMPLVQAGAPAPATGTLQTMSDNGGPDVPVGADTGPTQPSSGDSKSSGGDICGLILLVVITLGIALLIYCIGKWTTGEKCDPGEFFDGVQDSDEPDPRAPTNVTQQKLESLADPKAAAHLAQEMFQIQMTLWQGFDLALAFLAVTGLVYPDDLLLPSPLYQQFLLTPKPGSWPHREDPKALDNYHLAPATPIEEPGADAPYPALETPASIAQKFHPHSAGAIAAELIRDLITGQTPSRNFDLDADRGFRHLCWNVAPNTSISDPVLNVGMLPYQAE